MGTQRSPQGMSQTSDRPPDLFKCCDSGEVLQELFGSGFQKGLLTQQNATTSDVMCEDQMNREWTRIYANGGMIAFREVDARV